MAEDTTLSATFQKLLAEQTLDQRRLELALMALAGCGVIIYAEVCKNSKIDPGNIDIAVEAEKTPNSPVISNVTMKVNINSKARKGLVEAAWRRTEANCPVMFVYKEAMPVKVETEINAE